MDMEILEDDVVWSMQYSGFNETTLLMLYMKEGNNVTCKKYMKVNHVLNIMASGTRIIIMCR